jgi:hypothetical protein
MAVRPRAERHHRVVHRHHRFSLRGDVTVHIGGGGRASLVLDVGHHDPRCRAPQTAMPCTIRK